MAFSGLTSYDFRSAELVAESLGRIIAPLSPKEAPILDFIGDPDYAAIDTEHRYIEDYMLPNYIVVSTAVNSETAATGITINGLGLALSVGQLLENESAAPEVMQVTSIPGANSILVSRNYDGAGIGSLVVGGSLYVREAAGVTGQDHSGSDVHRLGVKKANTVGLFRMELAESGTAGAIEVQSNDRLADRVRKTTVDLLHQLEKAVTRGKWNSANSLGTSTTTRTMKGLRDHITTINSTVAANSFNADPHKYIGDVWQQMWRNGASDTETWGIIAGSTFFRDISNLNDTKVQDSNVSELFKRVIRRYAAPFGEATVFPSRVLPDTELLIFPRERVRVVPLRSRSFQYIPMAKTGDNEKGLLVGEYTLEVHHESGMARLRV